MPDFQSCPRPWRKPPYTLHAGEQHALPDNHQDYQSIYRPVIILRYFTREILTSTLVISTGLLLLVIGQRFSRYLGDAVSGDLGANAVFVILAFRVPDLLMLILPICFFLSVLLAYGRLHMDSEMVVLSSCGLSKLRLLSYTMVPAAIVALLVAGLTLFVSPYSKRQADDIIVEQRNRSELETLQAGRFQSVREGDPTTYFFERFSNDGEEILNIFIAERPRAAEGDGQVSVTRAASATDEVNYATGDRYLVMRDGYQYVGSPGEPDYQEVKFDSFSRFIPARTVEAAPYYRDEYASLKMLLEVDNPTYKAELQWRLSLPLFVLVITLIAVPLSHTDPRRGRFLKMFPGFIVAIFYLGGLTVAKSYVQQEVIPASIGLWSVHLIFLAIGLGLLAWNNGQALGSFSLAARKAVKSKGQHAQT